MGTQFQKGAYWKTCYNKEEYCNYSINGDGYVKVEVAGEDFTDSQIKKRLFSENKPFADNQKAFLWGTDNQIHNIIVSFIWGIADDCLCDVDARGKYRDVILPMTVIRRLDAMLKDTKLAVLEMKDKLDKTGITNQWPALCNAAGQAHMT